MLNIILSDSLVQVNSLLQGTHMSFTFTHNLASTISQRKAMQTWGKHPNLTLENWRLN